MFFDPSNVKTIASVQPYTPLELLGRDIYLREGCYNCHSQMVRPFRHETERYGEYSKAGEFVYDHPFQWGSKRTGPDLHRVGGKYPSLWHVRHMKEPSSTTPGLGDAALPAPADVGDGHQPDPGQDAGAAHASVCPTPTARSRRPRRRSTAQARQIAAEVEAQQGPRGLADKEIVALTAYLQRLGTDIKWQRPPTQPLVAAAAPRGRRRRAAGRHCGSAVVVLQQLAGETGASGWAIASMLFFLGVWLAIAVAGLARLAPRRWPQHARLPLDGRRRDDPAAGAAPRA